MEELAESASPDEVPDAKLPEKALGFRVQEYGMTHWRDLFTLRQLTALTTRSQPSGQSKRKDSERTPSTLGSPTTNCSLRKTGGGATAYAEAVSVYLALLSISRATIGAICVLG